MPRPAAVALLVAGSLALVPPAWARRGGGKAFKPEGPVPELTANPNASERAKEVLRFLRSLPERPNKRLLSGQFIGYGSKASLSQLAGLHESAGAWPAILGADYHDWGLGGPVRSPNKLLIEHWEAGGLVMISNHADNPASGGNVNDRRIDLADLAKPMEPAREAWLAELDTVADALQELRDRGVVVLWRPFHEMDGDWFWWGARDPKQFKTLWRQMFEHFTKVRRLDNLLWVYSPGTRNVTRYFPGSAYVDVVGVDHYQTHPAQLSRAVYRDLLAMGKPVGLTEYGPGGKAPRVEAADFSELAKAVEEHFPRLVFFHVWNDVWGMHAHQNADRLLSHPWVLNRPVETNNR